MTNRTISRYMRYRRYHTRDSIGDTIDYSTSRLAFLYSLPAGSPRVIVVLHSRARLGYIWSFLWQFCGHLSRSGTRAPPHLFAPNLHQLHPRAPRGVSLTGLTGWDQWDPDGARDNSTDSRMIAFPLSYAVLLLITSRWVRRSENLRHELGSLLFLDIFHIAKYWTVRFVFFCSPSTNVAHEKQINESHSTLFGLTKSSSVECETKYSLSILHWNAK